MPHIQKNREYVAMFKNKRAALYMRSSTEESEETIEQQYRELQAFVTHFGCQLKFKHIFHDIGCSGISDMEERPGLSRLMAAAERKEFDIVLVARLDRLCRKMSLLPRMLDKLKTGYRHKTDTAPIYRSGGSKTAAGHDFRIAAAGIIVFLR